MIPATNLSFAIKGGYRCAWEPIEMTPPSSGASAAELGSLNLEVESGNVEASEDGAWCIPQIQATFNGKVVGTALHVGDITKTNGTAFIAVLGGIGRGPLQLKGYAPKRPSPYAVSIIPSSIHLALHCIFYRPNAKSIEIRQGGLRLTVDATWVAQVLAR